MKLTNYERESVRKDIFQMANNFIFQYCIALVHTERFIIWDPVNHVGVLLRGKFRRPQVIGVFRGRGKGIFLELFGTETETGGICRTAARQIPLLHYQ